MGVAYVNDKNAGENLLSTKISWENFMVKQSVKPLQAATICLPCLNDKLSNAELL